MFPLLSLPLSLSLSGIGIPRKQQQQIFTAFAQGDMSTSKKQASYMHMKAEGAADPGVSQDREVT